MRSMCIYVDSYMYMYMYYICSITSEGIEINYYFFLKITADGLLIMDCWRILGGISSVATGGPALSDEQNASSLLSADVTLQLACRVSSPMILH